MDLRRYILWLQILLISNIINKKEKDDGVNRETVMKELALLLDDVLIHPAVAGEIKQLILGTGNEKKFIKQLTKQVGLLKEYGINVIQLPQFEKLKNYSCLLYTSDAADD